MSSRTLATSLVVGDLIAVNLVGIKPEGQRVAVQAFFNSQGQETDATGNVKQFGKTLSLSGVGAGGADAPKFNEAAFSSLINSGKTQAAEAMKIQYEIDLAEYETAGGSTNVSDSIRNAVLAWAKQNHNVDTKDRADGFVIKPENVIVKLPMRLTAATAGIIAVQLAPAWGAK